MKDKMSARNLGVDFDESWFQNVYVNLPAVKRRAETLGTRRTVKKQWQAAWLLRAVSCIDLTTLSGDDTLTNVQRLCFKAKWPIRQDLMKNMNLQDLGLTVGAICVYPNRVSDCAKVLKSIDATHIPVASVATGFPSGQMPLKTRLEEIRQAVADGASEIDIVINRQYALSGNWKGIYEEIRLMKEACGEAHLKTILATGDLGSLCNVYRASMVCMMAGADFIKTSTGKESVNATFVVALVMVRAIREYYHRTDYKVGFKPAGGIRSAKDSCTWLSLMKEELGDEWTKPNMFRIGASGLLIDIERQIFHFVTGHYAATHELPMA
ncbi:deoxyribose-phosphate aldolase-like [Gigantopelta aegis]|uniref:deoxyribose-phosphate aldolase-like n=1 Tax=Gigantopelta aegis TaxID=1735272 RepID=UPI001B889EA1|nr:deoxyribose-phosphate aldolase-like [Gigantopelta aegis]